MDSYIPPQPVPLRKDHALRNLAFGGFGCLILTAAVAALVILRFSNFAGGPSRIVQRQLNSINQGRIHTAYEDFTLDYRKHHSLLEFEKDLAVFANQLPCRSAHFSRVSVSNNKARVTGTLTGKDGSLFPVEYQLIRERGNWRIQEYRWELPGDLQKI